MQGGDIIRGSNSSPIAAPDRRRGQRDHAHSLALPAESLRDRMQRFSAHGPIDTVAASLKKGSATCQLVVDLTYHVVRCAYVGLAYVHEQTRTLEPIADAVPARVDDGRRWWAGIQRALFTSMKDSASTMSLANDPILLPLPSRRRTPSKHADIGRAVCVVPITLSEGLTAIFAVEPRNSAVLAVGSGDFAPDPFHEVVTLIKAMASVAAATLQTQAFRRVQKQNLRNLQTIKELREDLEEMDGAISLVTHELKTPLTTIIACLKMARRKIEQLSHVIPDSPVMGKTQGQIHDLLALASRHAEIEDRIADDLIDASRIRTAKLTLLRRPCDLGQIVRDSVEGQRIVSPTRSISVDVPDRAIPVSADPDRVAQVVKNFLTNALKYSPEVKPVKVRIAIQKTYARVSVRDFGPGLEKSELKRVWERYYQADGVFAQSRTGPGLGLGLYIGQEIIREHGGRVGDTSKPGHGATFWFTLPLMPSE